MVLAAVLVAAFVFSQTRQRSQIRISKDEAIAAAKREIDFSPRRTNVRLLRQGLNSRPVWFVNLSVTRREDGAVERLVVVEIDANTGRVEEVDRQR